MIFMPADKVVIMTPHRCASYALEKFFCGHKPGNYKSDHHGNTPPPRCFDWVKVLVVRNPYRRLESFYRLHQQFTGDFYAFSKSVLIPASTNRHPQLPTCVSFLEKNPTARVVRVECLKHDLEALGLPGDIPRFHESPAQRAIGPPNEVIRRWAKPDIDAFGYKEE